MKKVLKSFLKKRLAARGFKLVRDSEVTIPAGQFELTITAFEHLLNLIWKGEVLPGNEKRVDLLSRLLGTSIPEAYFIVRALASTRDVAGDVCEFGVAQGATSALIANEILASRKHLHLFDSFTGLARPSEKDSLKDDIMGLGNIQAYTGMMACPEALVKSSLQAAAFPFDRYIIHKGFVEQVLVDDPNLPKQVSFAYVDLDFYQPILKVLEYLDSVLTGGSVMIVDDYDFFSTGVKTAVDEFFSDRDRSIQYTLTIPDKAFGCFAILQRIK
jgi:O-methyltransferase